jgi:putative tributyrin esterase
MKTPQLVVVVAVLVTLAAAMALGQAAPAVKPKEANPNPHIAPVCADHHSFHSAALDREMAYCVLLPEGYQSSQERYPVLYLLHGLFGDENDWLAKTKLAEHAASLRLIVVTPEGDDSWYTNSAADPRNRYEDYIATDLIREVESHYRVNPSHGARFIAGLSMGGYGALKMGMKHPELFAMVGAFSAAGLNASTEREWQTVNLAFGPPGDPAHASNNLYAIAAKTDAKTLPFFMITCGYSDGLRNDDLQMASLMRELGVRYEYHEFPGRHEWPVWDRSVTMMLLYMRATGTLGGGSAIP